MKTNQKIKIAILGAVLICCSEITFAQESRTQPLLVKKPLNYTEEKKLQRDHFRRNLGLDSAKAEQVLRIQTEYKVALKQLEADTSLSDAGRAAKKTIVVNDKNKKLKSFLNPEQQRKIIPSSELAPTRKLTERPLLPRSAGN